NDTLTLPGGTYYFTSIAISGNSVITASGPVRIFCGGSISISSGTITGATGYDVRLWSSGPSVALSNATLKAFVYAPSASISLANATITGGVFGNNLTISGPSHVTRVIDDVAPHIAITSPNDHAAIPDPAHTLVKGTVSDGETDVSVKVNGQSAAISA